MSRALAEHGAQAMVTGQLLWAEFDTGRTEFINAGHVWPLLLRDGRVEEITPVVDLPFGIAPHAEYHVQSLDMRPGDRLVLLTDGMLEPHGHDLRAASPDRERPAPPPARSDPHPHAVRDEASDHDPRDDATVLCLDWAGPGWSDGTPPLRS